MIRNNANPHQLDRLKWIFNGQLPECLRLEYSDMTDAASVNRLVQDSKPDEIYNLAAQSHVGVSFKSPASTAHVNALGVLNILEACECRRKVLSGIYFRDVWKSTRSSPA